MSATKRILDNHIAAFGRGDLDAILADYAPDAVLFTSGGALHGAAMIRPVFQKLIAEFAKPGASFTLDHEAVAGEHAFILWHARTADNIYELATDTFFMPRGRIAVQSFAGFVVPRKD
ncbi:MAG: nuclear transport factor 2 family protein [Proteobacteria bacterium]|nr:nuclear transport factor 2 family protein [Pseudomonadota bacterium]